MLLHTSNTFVNYNHALKDAQVIFLGVPFSSTSYSASSRFGPMQIREALRLSEGTDKKWCDVGDLDVVPGSYEITAQRLRETLMEIKEENKDALIVIAGGEHLITLPISETLGPKTIVQLDAHSDTKQDIAGNEYTHQTWAYHASKFCNILQIGVTSWSKEEEDFVEKSNAVHAIDAKMFLRNDVVLEGPVHLSVDIDVLRNANTGYPQGAMDMKTLLKIINKIGCSSMDIVEICSEKVLNKRTEPMKMHLHCSRIL